MILWILGWIACGIVAYILLKLSVYIIRINGKLENFCIGPVWRYRDTLYYTIGCLICGPFALFVSILLTFGTLLCHGVEKYNAWDRYPKINNNKKSWFDKKSPF